MLNKLFKSINLFRLFVSITLILITTLLYSVLTFNFYKVTLYPVSYWQALKIAGQDIAIWTLFLPPLMYILSYQTLIKKNLTKVLFVILTCILLSLLHLFLDSLLSIFTIGFDFSSPDMSLYYQHKLVINIIITLIILSGFTYFEALFIPAAKPPSTSTINHDTHKLNSEHNNPFDDIALSKIVSIKSSGNYVEVNYLGNTKLYRMTTKHCFSLLPEDKFIRVHRSWIVNRDHIISVNPTSHGDGILTMSNDHKIKYSRHFKDSLIPG